MEGKLVWNNWRTQKWLCLQMTILKIKKFRRRTKILNSLTIRKQSFHSRFHLTYPKSNWRWKLRFKMWQRKCFNPSLILHQFKLVNTADPTRSVSFIWEEWMESITFIPWEEMEKRKLKVKLMFRSIINSKNNKEHHIRLLH